MLTPRHISRENLNLKRHMHPSVNFSTIYNSQDTGSTSMSVSRGMDKEVMVCIYNGTLHACVLSRVQFFATPWTVARQAPLPMEFCRQGYWCGLPCPFPGALADPGIEPTSLVSPALAEGLFNHCTI